MGNDHSQNNDKNHQKRQSSEKNFHLRNPDVVAAFNELKNGSKESVNLLEFERKAGKKLSELLWLWMGKNLNIGGEITLEQFSRSANTLSGISSDELIRILLPHQKLTCLEVSGLPFEWDSSDGEFVHSFTQNMIARGKDAVSIAGWINENCPRLLDPIRNKIQRIFYNSKTPDLPLNINSKLLSPVQFFVLRQSLPTTVFWPKPASRNEFMDREDWIPLYCSNANGLSINRFEANVFDYRGATIAIFRFNSDEIFAIAADEEWRHSCKPFGGPNCTLFKFHPEFKRIEATPPALYCNFKNRSSKQGIQYGNGLAFCTNEDLSNVQQIEVWGCAGMEALDEQRKMKHRHRLQAERNARVPLPGNWEDNPDKAILEMGGVRFSNERREYQAPDDHDHCQWQT